MTNKTQPNLEKYLEQSKTEFSKPTYEMYHKISYDQNKVKKFIKDERLAPMFPPLLDPLEISKKECSICYNYFPILNKSKCCSKGICTECFLQICPNIIGSQNDKCPYCRTNNYQVTYTKKKTTQNENKKVIIIKNKNENNKNLKFVELTRHSNEKARETFENEFKKIVTKLLEIKNKELNNGDYNDLIIHDKQKQLKFRKEREIFLSIRSNQKN
ncbi:protein sip5 [Anaeramoeba flamelloides]|uniref:Protein sip5 n=1 Tax=Anaeramoeba flamelloides TaxID=1746091 RepID=A0AAV7ZCM8_9EUKA|nr:protein sip5 [Anaeramoeba flamelloides]